MKYVRILTLNLMIALLLMPLISCQKQNKISISELRCEYLVNPLGIDAKNPRFTWLINQTGEPFKQIAYQIDIKGVWSSGKIQSGEQRARYSGTKALNSHTKYEWSLTVWDSKGNEISSKEPATFELAKTSLSDWKAQWISDDKDKDFEPSPLFRKTFEISKTIVSARAYVSATGYYELFINGQRVGKNFLDPGYTHYDKRMLYVTHDVTSLLQKDKNALAAVLGNGFYNNQASQGKGVWDFEKARWRNRPRLLCEIRINYSDGSSDIIASDATWKTNTGAYLYNNIYSGDTYDARKEEEGWNNSPFDDSQWKYAQITSAPAPLLVAQQMPAIQVVKEMTPVSVRSFGDSVYVFDLGLNISGLAKFKVAGKAGSTYRISYGELLKSNGRLEQGNINPYFHAIKEGEQFQTDRFTIKGTGKEEEFNPQFSYHGYRYIEVVCSEPSKLTKDNITGLFFHTNVPSVGSFSCSNELLNKIAQAVRQSYICNLMSIPTDCPQREKNGWTADAHVSIDLGLLNYDAITLYEKWMNDFIDNQHQDLGDIAGIIPTDTWGYGPWIGPVWDAALFIIPDAMYRYYGETQSIEQLYPSMQKYLKYLQTKEVDGYLNYGLGDWVSWKAQTPNEYTSTAYYYYDNYLMAQFAERIGKDGSEYAQKAATLKTLINKKFFNAESGIYANGTQTAQALALYLNIVPKEKEALVAKNLHDSVAANNYFLNFGLLGSKTVPAMLTKYGYVEDAYKMITKVEAPSWGYWVETMGYSTLAETWTLSPEFRDASVNHVFMGDVNAWMYNALAGINIDNTKPGYSNIIIQPHFVKDLQWVKGSYHSVKGLVSSSWERVGDRIILNIEIPANTTASLIVGDKIEQVESGIHQYEYKNN